MLEQNPQRVPLRPTRKRIMPLLKNDGETSAPATSPLHCGPRRSRPSRRCGPISCPFPGPGVCHTRTGPSSLGGAPAPHNATPPQGERADTPHDRHPVVLCVRPLPPSAGGGSRGGNQRPPPEPTVADTVENPVCPKRPFVPKITTHLGRRARTAPHRTPPLGGVFCRCAPPTRRRQRG